MANTPKKFAPPALVETPIVAETIEATAATVEATAAKVEAAVEAPAAAKDMRDSLRAIVEKGVVETRAKYAQAKASAEEASSAAEASFGAARSGVIAFNVKTLEAIKASADANFDLFKSLASAKTMSELVTLHTEFARKQFEGASAQAKELAELARKVADETAAPIKAHVAKTFKVAV